MSKSKFISLADLTARSGVKPKPPTISIQSGNSVIVNMGGDNWRPLFRGKRDGKLLGGRMPRHLEKQARRQRAYEEARGS